MIIRQPTDKRFRYCKVSQWAILAIILSLAGCNRSPAPQASKNAVAAEPPSKSISANANPPTQRVDQNSIKHSDKPGIAIDSAESNESDSTVDASMDQPPPETSVPSDAEAAPAAEAEAAVSSDVNVTANGELPEAPEMTYRLWLPTSAGPLLVGLEISLDDQSLRDAFEQKLQSVRDAVGEELSWDSLLEHVAADAATFGQASARVSGQEKGLVKRYDRNKNKLVDGDELVRFLFRESNFAGEFRLFGTDAFRWSNRSGSPLFRAIDLNNNRRLDQKEIRTASNSLLMKIDQNADECIDLMESTSLGEQEEMPWQRSRSNRQGNVAMDLAGFVNWSNLSYAMGGMFKTGPLFHEANPVSVVDSDRDQWISPGEAEKVLALAPAINLNVRFHSSGAAPGIQALIPEPQKQNVSLEESDRSVWIADRLLQIGIIAHDSPTAQNRVPREAFDQIDANKDGGIDESEIPDGAEDQIQFETLDVDEDGKLSYEEINQVPKQSESIWNFQLRARAAEHSDGVFAWLDIDHNHFLSTREIQATGQKLMSLLDGSDSIKPTDIPDTYLLQFGRGEPDQDATRFQITRIVSTEPDRRPSWATQMDANRDGDVSENEFPGPIESFQRLDHNQDGFLDADEFASATNKILKNGEPEDGEPSATATLDRD